MFKENDKLTLIITQAKNELGQTLPFACALPYERELKLPDDVKSISVFECHEGSIKKSSLLFTMYIGNKIGLDSLFKNFDNIHFNLTLANFANINSKTPIEVLYHIDDKGNVIVDNLLKKDDLVFNSIMDMENAIYELSSYAEQLNMVTNQIKLFRKPNKNIKK